MPSTTEIIHEMYAAFNRRDIEAVLTHFTDTIDWPKASEGGRVTGKDEIRAYWTRQWSQFDPHVTPLKVIDQPTGQTDVRVHQVVNSLTGELLSDLKLWHTYTLAKGLIERMDIKTDDPNDTGFTHSN